MSFARFQSTLPAGEATTFCGDVLLEEGISIHASRGGSDFPPSASCTWPGYFNPRFPRGKRRAVSRKSPLTNTYFNPRFPRGKRQKTALPPLKSLYFNPRFPRGKRQRKAKGAVCPCGFQSTLPAREATKGPAGKRWAMSYFNPRFPRGKRPLTPPPPEKKEISIHASREGSDYSRFARTFRRVIFQSTLPAREATQKIQYCKLPQTISIHASREGSDKYLKGQILSFQNFNPRFPRGKRQYGQAVP